MNKRGISKTTIYWIVGVATVVVILLVVLTPIKDYLIRMIENIFSFFTFGGSKSG